MLYERIKMFCKAKGITVTKLEQDLELGRSSVRKMDQHDPGIGKISMIAGYLGVTVDALLDDDYCEGVGRDAQKMYNDADMRDLFYIKGKLSPELFAKCKRIMVDFYRLENPNDDHRFEN